jgi:hypothetical protein
MRHLLCYGCFALLLCGCTLPAALAETIHLPLLTTTATTPDYWRLARTTTWQIQFAGDLDLSTEVELYDLDLFDTDPATIAELHQAGRRVICYISVGSWEEWRPDQGRFPAEILGKDYTGWPGEKWLDIRRLDLLGPIIEDRLDLCAQKGFDGVDPDNVDGYQNDTGFDLSAADQLRFNRWLAQAAHVRGLSIGLKNNPDQAAQLADDFDWMLTEACIDQGWCEQTLPFLERGKPVFAIEYTDTDITLVQMCNVAAELGLMAILKDRDLDATYTVCP